MAVAAGAVALVAAASRVPSLARWAADRVEDEEAQSLSPAMELARGQGGQAAGGSRGRSTVGWGSKAPASRC